ncbi:hypothetical protein [Nocardia brasiliensis]|uniref:hypothetical protein n=1 Tax=Nocardia brasiliensis TaxID=37326 RepID=UPI002454536A|nr:hypothetical protein [Nocardia brasiliensis]
MDWAAHEPPTGAESIGDPPVGTTTFMDASLIPPYAPECTAVFAGYPRLKPASAVRAAAPFAVAASVDGLASVASSIRPEAEGWMIAATAASFLNPAASGNLHATSNADPVARAHTDAQIAARTAVYSHDPHSVDARFIPLARPSSIARFTGTSSLKAADRPRASALLASSSTLAGSTKVSISDDFNRANGPLGGNYEQGTGLFVVIFNNVAGQPDEKSTNVVNNYWGFPNQRLGTDNHDVSAKAVIPVNGLEVVLDANQLAMGVGVRFKLWPNGSGVTAHMWDDQVSIYSWSADGTATERQKTTGLSIAAGSRLRLAAVGRTYTAYVNGTQRCQWVDSATNPVVPVGPDYRKTAFFVRARKISNGNYDLSSWCVDDWSAADV